jgi:hypothetical protein
MRKELGWLDSNCRPDPLGFQYKSMLPDCRGGTLAAYCGRIRKRGVQYSTAGCHHWGPAATRQASVMLAHRRIRKCVHVVR